MNNFVSIYYKEIDIPSSKAAVLVNNMIYILDKNNYLYSYSLITNNTELLQMMGEDIFTYNNNLFVVNKSIVNSIDSTINDTNLIYSLKNAPSEIISNNENVVFLYKNDLQYLSDNILNNYSSVLFKNFITFTYYNNSYMFILLDDGRVMYGLSMIYSYAIGYKEVLCNTQLKDIICVKDEFLLGVTANEIIKYKINKISNSIILEKKYKLNILSDKIVYLFDYLISVGEKVIDIKSVPYEILNNKTMIKIKNSNEIVLSGNRVYFIKKNIKSNEKDLKVDLFNKELNNKNQSFDDYKEVLDKITEETLRQNFKSLILKLRNFNLLKNNTNKIKFNIKSRIDELNEMKSKIDISIEKLKEKEELLRSKLSVIKDRSKNISVNASEFKKNCERLENLLVKLDEKKLSFDYKRLKIQRNVLRDMFE
ncbi:hypothetical protein HERIO_554 [Hepatospora eriocheir]|uniref:Uncharacterized protein n=1 Tax=Hepatospora eriocheir TaxID=1081669 RepID=A0A1X0QCT5_9MICR|nr:hypothetical protein HERIO_554 [Hepatospora eriocheir]